MVIETVNIFSVLFIFKKKKKASKEKIISTSNLSWAGLGDASTFFPITGPRKLGICEQMGLSLMGINSKDLMMQQHYSLVCNQT